MPVEPPPLTTHCCDPRVLTAPATPPRSSLLWKVGVVLHRAPQLSASPVGTGDSPFLSLPLLPPFYQPPPPTALVLHHTGAILTPWEGTERGERKAGVRESFWKVGTVYRLSTAGHTGSPLLSLSLSPSSSLHHLRSPMNCLRSGRSLPTLSIFFSTLLSLHFPCPAVGGVASALPVPLPCTLLPGILLGDTSFTQVCHHQVLPSSSALPQVRLASPALRGAPVPAHLSPAHRQLRRSLSRSEARSSSPLLPPQTRSLVRQPRPETTGPFLPPWHSAQHQATEPPPVGLFSFCVSFLPLLPFLPQG